MNGIEYLILVSLVPSDEAIDRMNIAKMVTKGTKLEIKLKTTQTPAMMPKNAMFWDGVSRSLSFCILTILPNFVDKITKNGNLSID